MTRPRTSEPPKRREPSDWLAAGMTALLVARAGVPSESALAGDGLLWVMLWLVMLVGWAAWGWARGVFEIRWQWSETLLLAMLGWIVISAGFGIFDGAVRPAINIVWEWTGLVVSFFLVRQIFTQPRHILQLVLAMVVAASVVSTAGLWETFVERPADRLAFENAEDQAAFVQQSGLRILPGSPSWDHFLQRLYSPETDATFGLANSLGGWLAPWIVIAIGWLTYWLVARRWRSEPVAGVGLLIASGLTTACLVFSQSRAGLLAVIFGLGLWWSRPLWRGWTKRTWAIALASVVVLAGFGVAGLAASGAGERLLQTGPGLSLLYRWQYWTGSAALVAERPLLGVGPGQFQAHYTRFKAETASEEVADPHNMLVEMATTTGLPGLVLLLAVFATIGWQLAHPPGSPPVTESVAPSRFNPVWVGVVFAAPLAWIIGLATGFVLPDLHIVVATVLLILGFGMLSPLADRLPIPAALLVIAALALGLNLLAAGGLTFPTVAQSGWLLLALALNLGAPAAMRRPGRVGPVMASTVSIALLLACFGTAYGPVSASRSLFDAALEMPNWQKRIAMLELAAEADPWNPDPPQALASGYVAQWDSSWGSTGLDRFERAAHDYREASGPADTTFYQLAIWYEQLAEKTRRANFRLRANEAYRKAIEWYPNHPLRWAQWSLSLQAGGEANKAAKAAAEAIRLHNATPHADKKLSDELLDRLNRINTRPAAASVPEPTSEQ